MRWTTARLASGAEKFEEVAWPKGKAKAKAKATAKAMAKSESKPKAKAQPKSILKKPTAHAAGREYWASRLQQVQVQPGLLPQLFLKPFATRDKKMFPPLRHLCILVKQHQACMQMGLREHA